jgi:oxygen-independent coproporphyrinogen III oxidase
LAGIYLHIPFCRQKCHYCNFYSITSVKNRDKFLETLNVEIEIQKDYLEEEKIETIYFGGGTPSLLSSNEINRILDNLAKNFKIDPAPEITLEANPDDLNPKSLSDLKKTPVNRLSIGVQSFFDQDLKYLNRVHSAKDAVNSIRNAIDAGFKNLSIDLIYGIPTLTEQNWLNNLETFFSLNLPHLSAYALTVEAKTVLDVLIRNKKMKPVDEEKLVLHFNSLMALMKQRNYVQYEISNFCLEPNFSKHNTSYWSGKKYLGLGPSAHSFNGTARQWNVSNLSTYLLAIENKTIPAESEFLTENQHYNEYILTSLRTMWGTDLNFIEKTFGQKLSAHFHEKVTRFQNNKWISHQDGKYFLTNKGKLFADGIAAELFV